MMMFGAVLLMTTVLNLADGMPLSLSDTLQGVLLVFVGFVIVFYSSWRFRKFYCYYVKFENDILSFFLSKEVGEVKVNLKNVSKVAFCANNVFFVQHKKTFKFNLKFIPSFKDRKEIVMILKGCIAKLKVDVEDCNE